MRYVGWSVLLFVCAFTALAFADPATRRADAKTAQLDAPAADTGSERIYPMQLPTWKRRMAAGLKPFGSPMPLVVPLDLRITKDFFVWQLAIEEIAKGLEPPKRAQEEMLGDGGWPARLILMPPIGSPGQSPSFVVVDRYILIFVPVIVNQGRAPGIIQTGWRSDSSPFQRAPSQATVKTALQTPQKSREHKHVPRPWSPLSLLPPETPSQILSTPPSPPSPPPPPPSTTVEPWCGSMRYMPEGTYPMFPGLCIRFPGL